MSWSGWGSRLNVTSIVSQGLEQVSKLREDVEKQFDQVVTGVNGAPYLRPSGATSATTNSTSGENVEASSEDAPPPPLPPVVKAPTASVDDIGVSPPLSAFGKDVLANLRLQQQPPASADGKRRLGGMLSAGASSLTAVFPPLTSPDEASPLFAEEKAAEPAAEELVDSEKEVKASSGDAKVGALPGDSDDACVASSDELEEKPPVDTPLALGSQDAKDAAEVERRYSDKEAHSDHEEEDVPVAEAKQNADGGFVSEELEAADADDVNPTGDSDTAEVVAEDAPGAEVAGDVQEVADGDTIVEQEVEGGEAERVDADDATAVDDRDDTVDGESAVSDEDSTANVTTDAAVIDSLRRGLQLREAQLLATSSTIAELHNELDKTCQREVAAVERARNLSDQVERMRIEMEQQASSMPRPSELQALQFELAEKDAQLKALLEEGNALSVKQSQYEQRLRVLRKEKDEEEERRLKFQMQSEALSVQVQDLTGKLKAAEDESKSLAKEVRELQSNAQSTSKKLAKAEQDAATASSQLESAQALVKTLSEDNQAMQSKLESLKGTTQSHDALTVEKQEMQRTIDFLQHSIRELEEESRRREEMARAEMQSMKKKWLDAVGRVDMMGQSVSEATQPLLHQINALREDLRARQDGWKATETALLARIEDSNELRLAMEREKLEADQEVHALRAKIDALKSEVQGKQIELNREKEKLDAALQEARELRGQVDATHIELDETKVKLDDETHAKQQLMARVNAERLKKRELAERSESTGGTDSSNSELAEAREREAQLRMQLERSQSELSEVKALLESNGVASRSHLGLSSSSRDGSSHELGDSDAPGSSNGSLITQASILKSTLESPSDNTAFLGANTTVLGLSQLQQRLRLAEGEKRMLKQQLAALEAKQKQNTDDIVRLSTRNALLETKETELHQMQQELVQLKQRQQVLLELFGEKEEQVEELQAEVGELKAFYRKQLDTLAGQQR